MLSIGGDGQVEGRRDDHRKVYMSWKIWRETLSDSLYSQPHQFELLITRFSE